MYKMVVYSLIFLAYCIILVYAHYSRFSEINILYWEEKHEEIG